MPSGNKTASISNKQLWAGRIVSAIPILFLLFDGVLKLLKPVPVVDATKELGYPDDTILGLGITLLVCTILYAIPRASVLGAILLTGYLGGAIATHVRVHGAARGSLFEILFPAIVGVLVWGGLYLRDERLRSLIPLRS
jgi:hypothetical protein